LELLFAWLDEIMSSEALRGKYAHATRTAVSEPFTVADGTGEAIRQQERQELERNGGAAGPDQVDMSKLPQFGATATNHNSAKVPIATPSLTDGDATPTGATAGKKKMTDQDAASKFAAIAAAANEVDDALREHVMLLVVDALRILEDPLDALMVLRARLTEWLQSVLVHWAHVGQLMVREKADIEAFGDARGPGRAVVAGGGSAALDAGAGNSEAAIASLIASPHGSADGEAVIRATQALRTAPVLLPTDLFIGITPREETDEANRCEHVVRRAKDLLVSAFALYRPAFLTPLTVVVTDSSPYRPAGRKSVTQLAADGTAPKTVLGITLRAWWVFIRDCRLLQRIPLLTRRVVRDALRHTLESRKLLPELGRLTHGASETANAHASAARRAPLSFQIFVETIVALASLREVAGYGVAAQKQLDKVVAQQQAMQTRADTQQHPRGGGGGPAGGDHSVAMLGGGTGGGEARAAALQDAVMSVRAGGLESALLFIPAMATSDSDRGLTAQSLRRFIDFFIAPLVRCSAKGEMHRAVEDSRVQETLRERSTALSIARLFRRYACTDAIDGRLVMTNALFLHMLNELGLLTSDPSGAGGAIALAPAGSASSPVGVGPSGGFGPNLGTSGTSGDKNIRHGAPFVQSTAAVAAAAAGLSGSMAQNGGGADGGTLLPNLFRRPSDVMVYFRDPQEGTAVQELRDGTDDWAMLAPASSSRIVSGGVSNLLEAHANDAAAGSALRGQAMQQRARRLSTGTLNSAILDGCFEANPLFDRMGISEFLEALCAIAAYRNPAPLVPLQQKVHKYLYGTMFPAAVRAKVLPYF
jgi:hypothetical protein